MATRLAPHIRPTALVSWDNEVQTVAIPLAFRFPRHVREVFVRREGESLILTPRPNDWSDFFAAVDRALPNFMARDVALPIQDRPF